MANHSQLEEGLRKQFVDQINQRWSQLYHLEKEWADKAVNFLFLTNSGGSIAMLGFIGSRQQVNALVVWGLGIMLLGLIFVGFLIAHGYHRIGGLFDAWRKDVREYFLDRISWEKLNEDDASRSKSSMMDLFLGYGSLLCFVLGIVLGIRGFLVG